MKILLLLLMISLSTLLIACGQTGDLSLPRPDTQPHATQHISHSK